MMVTTAEGGGGMTGAEAFTAHLAAARDGEPSAWVALHDDVAPLVHAYLRHQSLDDPDDVAGETLLQVVRDLHRFHGDHRQFRSWVLTIAHHRMLDARRARGRRPADPVPVERFRALASGPTDASEAALQADSLEHVLALLAGLTEEQRTVVLLRVLGDLTLEEVAAVLGRTVGSVKALQHRAFVALRARLSDDRNPGPLAGAHPAWHP